MVKKREPYGPAGEDATYGDSVDRAERRQAEGPEPGGQPVADGQPVDWLGIAKSSYEDSTRFLDSSLRAQWERNERAFQSRHPSGSKYHSDAYKGRSKLFRPKTRTSIRQGDAALAASMFANEDVIAVKPADENNPQQQASALINKEIMQYRMTTPNPRIGIPWFLTCVGAGQDAQKYGTVFSKQSWLFESRTEEIMVPLRDEETGEYVVDDDGRPHMTKSEIVTVIKDKPTIDLIPPENLRLDRGCDWRDPINSSPYLIILTPMYVADAEAMMERDNPKTGQKAWHKLDRAQLKSASSRYMWDSTRTQRDGNREDSKESESAVDDFHIVWVHENFVRMHGREYVYFTAGTQHLLSDPVPMEEVYRHCADGNRPVTVGYSVLETHRIYPSGKPQLVENLQWEANEIVNQRLDNLKLALNKRYVVRRGAQVDLRSLLRNIPGSVTLANDPEQDIKVIETRDVTQSAYQEQDRINVDFDDIVGGFSPGTIQTNRRMNETVGGMQMISGAANMLQELDLRTFIETWAEPTIGQVIKMIQTYETDETIIALAGDRARLYQRFGIDTITDELLRQDLTVRVNVGIGATDPERRLNKILVATKTVVDLLGPQIAPHMQIEEIVKEIYGAVGYRDGSRFFKFNDQDPMVLMLLKQIEQLQRSMERKELDAQTKLKVAEIQATAKMMTQRMESETELQKQGMRTDESREIEYMRGMHEHEIESRRRLGDIGQIMVERATEPEPAAAAAQTNGAGEARMPEIKIDTAGFEKLADAIKANSDQQSRSMESALAALTRAAEQLAQNDDGTDKLIDEMRRGQDESARQFRDAISEIAKAVERQAERAAARQGDGEENEALQMAAEALRTSGEMMASAAQTASIGELTAKMGQMAEQQASLIQQLSKPKKVVYNDKGRPERIE